MCRLQGNRRNCNTIVAISEVGMSIHVGEISTTYFGFSEVLECILEAKNSLLGENTEEWVFFFL
jgi:hypothetical protein